MKKSLFIWAFLCIAQFGFSQNLISNPDFELGPVPTLTGQINYATGWTEPCTDAYMFTSGGTGADLVDRNSTNSSIKVPANTWGTLDERTGDNRYAHLWQTEDAFIGAGGAAEIKGERITGTLTETLKSGCYNVCFWAAVAPTSLTNFDKGKQIIEVLLVNGNSCSGLLLFETPAIPNVNTWNQYCKTFTLSDAQSGIYNRILFRIKSDGVADVNHFSVYIDETSLVNTTPAVTISGNTQFCYGQSSTLTAGGGYTNYLWSNGATSQSINVTTGGTYTVNAWNTGSVCQAVGSVNVTVIPLPKIILPTTISICNSNFQPICGPSNTASYNFTYSWYFNNTLTNTSVLVSNNQCYTPTQYGSYTLVVTNQFGCTSSLTTNVIQGVGPVVTIKNVKFCGKSPLYVGFPAAYSDAVSYQWTYNGGTPFMGGYRINNMGEGQYCVTVTWNTGCTSTTCFTVEECCTPNTEFTITYNPFGTTASITVQNNTANTPHYDSEDFLLYQDCGSGWILYTSISRTTNFNLPITFTNLNKNCTYKVVHRVNSLCLMKSFSSEEFAYGRLAVNFYSNPVLSGEPVVIEINSLSKESTIEINDLSSGKLIYKKTVSNGKPIQVNYDTFARNSKGAAGIYNVKVYDESGTVNKKLIVQ
jgi:hypothetical protein